MYAQVGKSKKGAKKQPATGGLPGSAGRSEPASQFVDCRPEAIVQRKLQGMVNNSTQVKQLKGFIQMANNSPQAQRNREYAIDYNKPVPGPMGEPGFIATPGNPLHQPIQRKPEDFGNLYLSKLKTGFKFSGSKTHPFSDDSPFEDLKDFVKAYSKLNIGNINGRQDQLAKIKRQVGIWRAFYTNTLVPRYELTDKVDHFARKSAVDILEPLIEAEYAELGARDAEVNTKTQTLRSIRFQGDYILEEVAQGNVTLTGDEAGIYVLKVQRALIDSGKLADDKASKKFDAPTKTAIKGFQGDEAITQSENLDADTMNKMDEKFRTYAVEGAIAKNKPANITGTHVLDPHEKRGVKSAISTGVKVNVVTGELPTFTEDIGHMDGNYKARVKAKVEAIVESQYRAMGHGKGALHSDESNLLEWDAIKSIGGKSKEVVDAVFGKYKKGPAMKPNVSIFDAWDYKENILKKVKAQNAAVNWRVRKIITGKSQIREIDREHGAVQSRNAEKKILDEIIAEVTLAKRDKLLETHKGWSGFQANGKVYIQRFKESTKSKNRDKCWRLFRTCIHEYMHTLEHPDCVNYRQALDEKVGGFTIREGFTDYFTKIVWGNLDFGNSDLRAEVEGDFHEDDSHPIPPMGAYSEAVNAERVAGIIGTKNLYAAYFLGQVDRLRF